MFSVMTHDIYDEATAKTSSNILDILQATGVAASWFDNNSGCKGVCDRIPSEFLFQQPDARCKDGQCLDDVLLDALARALKTKTDGDRIIVIHQLGSHGPEYFKRSAGKDKVFAPECQDKQLQLCDRAEIINAYDNSIVATDRLLATIIAQLQQQEDYNAAMLYMSDHGESLGENGVYLHGLPYFMAPEEQTHIPLVWWMSSGYQAISKLNTDCLAQSRDKQLSHDHLFHSLLGVFSVQTSLYQPSLDMFSGCKIND
jgi:lipid A ethanolaminephosphotransferase